MKKKVAVVLSILLTVSFGLIGCNSSGSPLADTASPTAVVSPAASSNKEPLFQSYYAGQDSKAFRMFNKNIFKSSWYGDYKELKWNYDSFTAYAEMDAETGALSGDNLYCCTFSAADGKCGYVVISYSAFGPSLSKVRMAETPYLYDLSANLDEISEELEKAGVKPATAKASRVSVISPQDGTAKEAIYVTDADGHSATYYFESAASV